MRIDQEKTNLLAHEFVKIIPDDLKERTLYVSLEYGTVMHKCVCGCGSKIVTPLSPTDWALTYDGVSISLDPSIGNWNLKCQSHYWITESKVTWAKQWSAEQIAAGREQNRRLKDAFYEEGENTPRKIEKPFREGIIKRFWKWFIQ